MIHLKKIIRKLNKYINDTNEKKYKKLKTIVSKNIKSYKKFIYQTVK